MRSTLKHQRVNAPAQNTYQIEKGIKLPAVKAYVYGFDKMDVGDSFALLSSDNRERQRVRSAASYYGHRNGKKFGIRITDPVTKKLRCWRIK